MAPRPTTPKPAPAPTAQDLSDLLALFVASMQAAEGKGKPDAPEEGTHEQAA